MGWVGKSFCSNGLLRPGGASCAVKLVFILPLVDGRFGRYLLCSCSDTALVWLVGFLSES